jgi:hypothetical protein
MSDTEADPTALAGRVVPAPKAFTVPATIAEAVESANLLGELAFAAGWQRSAIVRAFCTKGRPGPKTGDVLESQQISMSKFAELGIIGLRDRNTVSRYYNAWEITGLPNPEPGMITDIPSPEVLDFPAIGTVRNPKPAIEASEDKPVVNGESGDSPTDDSSQLDSSDWQCAMSDVRARLQGHKEAIRTLFVKKTVEWLTPVDRGKAIQDLNEIIKEAQTAKDKLEKAGI